MKRFINPMSGTSILISQVMANLAGIIVFRPSIWELAVLIGVDMLAYLVIAWFDLRLFSTLFPSFGLIFPEVKKSEIQELSVVEKTAFLSELVKFPWIRAAFFFVASWIKAIPAVLIVVFYWKHDISNLGQFLKFFCLEAVVFSYMFGCVFLEMHDLVSRFIAECHEEGDWTEAFRRVEYPMGGRTLGMRHAVSFGPIAFFFIPLQILVMLWVPEAASISERALYVVTVGVVGAVLFARLWYLERRFFVGGLKNLFDRFERLDYNHPQFSIPLHSSPILARFERTFNVLTERLSLQEKELSHWVIHETEQGRYRALGEISGLVVHDLAGPLQTILFCTEEIASKLEGREQRYNEQLRVNAERAVQLISSLRAYLKNPDSDQKGSSYVEVHEYVLRLLKTQFKSEGFERVKFTVDSFLDGVRFSMSRVDLIHVVHNLYKNSVENMLRSQVSSPEMSIRVEALREGFLSLYIEDNGTGLDHVRFEKMTAFRFLPSSNDDFREGLGLRLTRRLMERHGGSLTIDPAAATGTRFRLVLKVMDANVV